VANQSYSHIEYIIVDGGSTDNTLDIIKKYETKIDQWISEPDDGIADAMNKGGNLATGDYILFLHSDDYILDSTALERASSFLHRRLDLYIFPVLLKKGNLKKTSTARSLGILTNFKMGSCHQGQLCSRKLFNKIEGFDTSYKVAMDFDFILRAYRTGAQSCSIKFPLSVMRLTGISSKTDWKSLQKRFQEERRAHYSNCPTVSMRLLYTLYWTLYLPYRRTRYLATCKHNNIPDAKIS
jgi:glycosyltransferase involved in cell wall biosynthesis